jgi:hypothetical protein
LVVAKTFNDELWWGESAPGGQCGPHAVVAEADNVGAAIAGEICHEADMLIDPPALVVAKTLDDELWWGESAPGGQCGPHAVVAEADEILAPITVDVCEQARVAIFAPAIPE